MIGEPEWAEVVQLLRAVARTEIMPRFRKLEPGMVRTKSGPTDLVTEADEAAEIRITAGPAPVVPWLPGDRRGGLRGRPGLARPNGTAPTSPSCSTRSTARRTTAPGLPLFGVMAAAVVAGEVVASAIHDPVCDDTAVALRGMAVPG